LLRSRQLWLGILGTVLFLGLFFWRTNLGDIADAFADANYWWFVPAVALWFVSAWFRSLRWRYLLRPISDLSSQTLYPVMVIGYMANNLLPARTGELVRAYIMGERHRVSMMATLGTISVERLFDGLVLLAFLVFVGAFVGLSEELTILAIVMSVVFVLLLAAFLFVASSAERAQRVIEALARFAPARVRDRARSWASAFVAGLEALRSPAALAAVVLTSTVAWALEATMYFMVGVSFSLGEAFPIYLMVAAAANLAITVPSTSGGIGPFEALAKETLVFVGVGSSAAAAYAVALHALLLLPVVAVGLVFLWAINLSLGEALRMPASPKIASGVGPTEASE
jgi:uncharacterized protein (TIRG00374 family)